MTENSYNIKCITERGMYYIFNNILENIIPRMFLRTLNIVRLYIEMTSQNSFMLNLLKAVFNYMVVYFVINRLTYRLHVYT